MRKAVEQLLIEGRYIVKDHITYLGYSGSGLLFHFSGTSLSIGIYGHSDKDLQAYLCIQINEDVQRYPVQEGFQELSIISSNTIVDEDITIFKSTEAQYGIVGLGNLTYEGTITSNDEPQKHLLFIGDSLTAGYGLNTDDGNVVFTTSTEAVELGYTYLYTKKRQAKADYVCWSGNGIISRYVDPSVDKPFTDYLMPKIFPYEDLYLSTCLKLNPEKVKKRSYDEIYINLGTNDESYTRSIKDREEHFYEAFIQFIQDVRNEYPDTPIYITYGLLDQSLMELEKKAVEEIKTNISFIPLPLCPQEMRTGVDKHANRQFHKEVSEYLYTYLKK